jgi:hypothetical protein
MNPALRFSRLGLISTASHHGHSTRARRAGRADFFASLAASSSPRIRGNGSPRECHSLLNNCTGTAAPVVSNHAPKSVVTCYELLVYGRWSLRNKRPRAALPETNRTRPRAIVTPASEPI